MQQDIQLWALLLWLTGTLLELQKCSYHVIHFDFKEDGTPQLQTQPPDTPLWLKQANTENDITITYKLVYNPHKTLGHYKAPAGTSKVQATILMEKAEKYACNVKKSSLNQHEAWMYHTRCYLKLLGYVLGQTLFPKHALENIDRPSTRTFASKCRATSDTQKLLQVAILWVQHQSGWHKSLLEDTLPTLPHIESQWIPSLCEYLGRTGATTLSNITLADGKTIDPHMRSGNLSLCSSSMK
eukprot:4398107-Ditylum_brightwellii.AAC.1